MAANSEKILEMMKTQEMKTLQRMKDLEAGLIHLQKKIKYYSFVNDAVSNNLPIPSWNDIIGNDQN